MEANQIVQEVFNNMGKMYESIFETYYPSHKSNGFTERNLTFYFSHFYLKNATNLSDIIIWQEVPIQGGEHFDTLIIDTINEMIFIIEAKRLQNEGKLESIKYDFNRILDVFNKINDINDIIKIPNEYSGFNKYALLLSDIWIPKKKNINKITIKENFEKFGFDCNLEEYFENKCIKIESMDKWSTEEYLIMYNLYKIPLNSKNEIQNSKF